MRLKATAVQHFTLGLALLAALCWNLAHGAELTQVRVDSGATGTRAELSLDRETPFQVISLSNPERLVIDLPGTAAGRRMQLPAPAGLVQRVRSGTPVPGTTRIVFELGAAVVALKPRFEPGADGARLVLEWPGDEPVPATPGTAGSPVVVAVAPRPDPAVASSAATARLIANLPPAVSVPPSPPRVTATPATVVAESRTPASEVAVGPTTAAPATVVTSAPPAGSRIATGVPTRVATGVPARVGTAPATPPASPQARTDVPRSAPPPTQADLRRGMRPLVIAIDPGHGGQDPGAVGLQGKREKDITLAIARELARQVNATPGLRAYLTRDTDVFIALPRRAQLARANKADLFVSIHADAAENRNARGSSVYVLSLRGASSQRARWLADKENSADLIGGVRLKQADNTLASVLLDLTQSGHMKASEDAAAHVLSGLKQVGANHKPNIERANFAVLRTSDMPAMLVETAFISNPDEERRLGDPVHQRALAAAVLGGINTYFTAQPPPGTVYAARADAGDGGYGGGSR